MQLVKDLERYAWLKGKDAERAREVYGAKIAQHRVDEHIQNACWRRLEARKPSTKFSVLEKREYKMNELIRQWLFSEFELAAVGQANAEAHVESLMFALQKTRKFVSWSGSCGGKKNHDYLW